MESRFSHPSGSPNSAEGKGSGMKWIGSLDWEIRSVAGLMRDKLAGVVINETVMPRRARRRAMSIMGIMWPWASHGTTTKCWFW